MTEGDAREGEFHRGEALKGLGLRDTLLAPVGRSADNTSMA